jgi:predicted transcriptional regulator
MKRNNVLHLDAELFSSEKRELSDFSLHVMKAIKEKWPTNPLEIAKELDEKGSIKTLSAKYLYHFRKLNKLGLIDMKRIGNTYVAWPKDIEKLRVLHEMIR